MMHDSISSKPGSRAMPFSKQSGRDNTTQIDFPTDELNESMRFTPKKIQDTQKLVQKSVGPGTYFQDDKRQIIFSRVPKVTSLTYSFNKQSQLNPMVKRSNQTTKIERSVSQQ